MTPVAVYEYMWGLEACIHIRCYYSPESNRSMDGTGMLEGVIICKGLFVHFAKAKCYKK